MIANHLLGKTESTSSFISHSYTSSIPPERRSYRARRIVQVYVLDTLDSDTDYTSQLLLTLSLLTVYEIPSKGPKHL